MSKISFLPGRVRTSFALVTIWLTGIQLWTIDGLMAGSILQLI